MQEVLAEMVGVKLQAPPQFVGLAKKRGIAVEGDRDARDQWIVDRYIEGHKVTAIAEAVRITKFSVHDIVRKRGAPRFYRPPKRRANGSFDFSVRYGLPGGRAVEALLSMTHADLMALSDYCTKLGLDTLTEGLAKHWSDTRG